MKRLLLLAGVFSLFLAMTNPVRAGAEDQVNKALSASIDWINQIDARHYDESYQFGGEAFRDKVKPDRWLLILKTLREPLGKVTSRKQTAHIFKPNGFEGASGEFMVVTYDTSFANLPGATEVVVLRWEGGKWRGAGYNAGSRPTEEDAAISQQNTTTTEVNTQLHVKPEPK